MKWFKHDSDATQDAKIKKLLLRYGVTGYAIYFHCLELIAGNVSEANITFELEHDSEIIADNLRIRGTSEHSGIEIVEEIMRFIISIDLFQQVGNKIFCYKMLKRIDASMASDGFRKLILKAKESHDKVMIESCPSHDNIMLDYTRTDKTRIENTKQEDAPALPSPSSKQDRFTKPTLDQVQAFITENKLTIDAGTFVDYYESNGWMIGKSRMKNWQATLKNWQRRDEGRTNAAESKPKVKKEYRWVLASDSTCPFCGKPLVKGDTFCRNCNAGYGYGLSDDLFERVEVAS